MKFSRKIGLVTVISFATVAGSAGIAGAANSLLSGNVLQSRPSICERSSSHQNSPPHKEKINSLSQILGLTPEELASELRAGKSLQDIAASKGIAPAKLAEDLNNAFSARIDAAVQSGKLAPEKAAELKARLPEKVQALITEKGLAGQGHKPSAAGRKAFKGIHTQLEALLGLDSAALRAELRNGKSLADLAQAKGLSKEALVAKIQSLVESNLAQAVKEQKITASEAAELKQDLTTKIEAMVTKQHPLKPQGNGANQ